jgi:hypothetical protein
MANDPVGYSDVPDGFSVESHGVATATLPPPATQPAYADVPDGFEVEHTPAAQQAAPAQPHPAMPTPTEPQAAAQAQQPAGSPFGGGPLPGEAYQERVTPPTKLPVAEQAPTAPKTQTPAGPTQADLDIQDATWSIAAKLPKVSPRPDYASHGADVAEHMAGLTPEDYFDTQGNRKIAAQLEWEAKNRSPQEKAAGDFPERLAAAYREHADALNTGQIKPGNYLPQEMTAAGQVHRMLAAYRSVDNTAAILGTDAPAKAKEDAAAVVGFKAQQMASENPELANFYIEAQNALLDDAKGKLS